MAHNLPSATNPENVSFEEDPRAFFNKETGTWRLEDDDGAEFEYDQAKSVWVPLVSNLIFLVVSHPPTPGISLTRN
jgi:hypothetical protein